MSRDPRDIDIDPRDADNTRVVREETVRDTRNVRDADVRESRTVRDDDVRDRRNVREDDTQTVQLREEELRARKQSHEAGSVEIGKRVVEEEKTLDVPVTREEVVIERHAVERRPARGEIGSNETIEVPVYEEEVDVEKRAVVYEELSVGKQAVQDTEKVTDTVRREVADLQTSGQVDVRGWDEARSSYRQAFESRQDRGGRKWEDVEDNYRYGHEVAMDPAYKGREFEEVEPELRSRYTESARRQGGKADDSGWEGLRQDAREAWNSVRGRR